MSSKLKHMREVAGLAREAYRIMQNGNRVALREIPDITSSIGFLYSAEGCALYGNKEVYYPVKKVFDQFDPEMKRKLTFTPEQGEFCARVRLWQAALKPSVSRAVYMEAMRMIYGCYRRIKQLSDATGVTQEA